jgi:hypothetical protein
MMAPLGSRGESLKPTSRVMHESGQMTIERPYSMVRVFAGVRYSAGSIRSSTPGFWSVST